MTKIVFACKSNSCRSQMAEGWAKEWIRRERDDLDRKLARPSSLGGVGSDDCSASAEPAGPSGKDDNVSGELDSSEEYAVRTELLRRSSTLDEVVITSVALDASAVFECGTCCGDLCETPSQRKAVKGKAVTAMAEDGVDISSFVPKTIEEIMPRLVERRTTSDDAVDGSSPAKVDPPVSATVDEISAAYSSTLFLSDDGGENPLQSPVDPEVSSDPRKSKPVDKLIVLCSCGDDVKRRLVRRSKSVEEWNVDAPTAAAKREGDGAYRRVSHEIRREVELLLDSLLGDDSGSDAAIRSGLPLEEKKQM